MNQRIRYKDNLAVVSTGNKNALVFLKRNVAVIKKGRTVIYLKASSSHKVKIAVKSTLQGLGFKFKQERRV